MSKEILIGLMIVAIVSLLVVFGIKTYIKFKTYQQQKRILKEVLNIARNLRDESLKDLIKNNHLTLYFFDPDVFEEVGFEEISSFLKRRHPQQNCEIPEDDEEFFCCLLEETLNSHPN